MSLEEVKKLKGGKVIKDIKSAQKGVIVDQRLTFTKKRNIILIQWIGGGCSIWVNDAKQLWENIQVID